VASAIATLRALQERSAKLTNGKSLAINLFDKMDLCKLTAENLVKDFDWDEDLAQRADAALSQGDVGPLAVGLGITLIVDRTATNLIPGEGFRRTSELLAEKLQGVSTEQVLDEIYAVRHPVRPRNGH